MATCPECRKEFPEDVRECPEHGMALLPAAIFANEDKELEVGATVGDYRIESKLGEGSFGRVYRAAHPIIGRRVAVKVLNRAMSTDPHAVSRFVAEARAIVEVQSPHIVDIYSFGALPDGRQYYVMELLEGKSLYGYMCEHGALDVPVALRILGGMADALAAAHAASVVHRDLKPENVFIVFDRAGEPVAKLLDFGVAKLLGDRKLAHRTGTGAMVGTPGYMAPEQALGLEIDHRADIYAFGLVAFEMLSGRLPFEAKSLIDLVRKHATEPPPPLSSVRPGLGEALDAAVARMLEKDPGERPQTIDEAFAGLRGAAERAGHSVTIPTYMSLRPPPSAPSAPGQSGTVSWDAQTLLRPETGKPTESGSAGTVGGTAGDARQTEPLPASRPSRLQRRLLVGGAALVAAGTLVALSPMMRSTPGAPPSAAVSARASSEPTESSAPPAAPSPAPSRADTVTLTVETTVPDAHVYLGPSDLGVVPGPFTLPRGAEPLALEVRAAGYRNAPLSFVPTASSTLKPVLERLPSGPATRPPGVGGKSGPTSAATVSPEIAVPYGGQ